MSNGIFATSQARIETHAMQATCRIAVMELTGTPAFDCPPPAHSPHSRSSLSPERRRAKSATRDQKPIVFQTPVKAGSSARAAHAAMAGRDLARRVRVVARLAAGAQITPGQPE